VYDFGVNLFVRRIRATIVFQSDVWFRNYLESGNLEHLCHAYDLTLILDGTMQVADKLLRGINRLASLRLCKITYTIKNSLDAQPYETLFDILLWLNRSKSKSFKYRIKRNLILTERIFDVSVAEHYSTINNLFQDEVIDRFMAEHQCSEALEEIVLRSRPELLLMPSAAYEAITNDILRNTRIRKKCLVVMMIDNWDNLCSKTIIPWHPDLVTCMGKQQVGFAADIHGIDPQYVHAIGCPRFDIYRSSFTNSDTIQSGLPSLDCRVQYILYLGSSQPNNEVSILQQLSYLLASLNIKCGLNQHIVYKPHPSRRFSSQDVEQIRAIPYVSVDQDSLSGIFNISSHDLFPSLDGYQALIKNASLVISGPTTMVLESLLCGKRTILMTDDCASYSSNKKLYDNLLHFEGIEELPGLEIMPTISHLLECINIWLHSDQPYNPIPYNKRLEYYLYFDEIPWAHRLIKVLTDYLPMCGQLRNDDRKME